jgi:hypothetical protein
VASTQTLERRIAALEARLADIEGGYADTLYHLRRASIKSELPLGKILDHLQIDDVKFGADGLPVGATLAADPGGMRMCVR